jgi:hypothetical protein
MFDRDRTEALWTAVSSALSPVCSVKWRLLGGDERRMLHLDGLVRRGPEQHGLRYSPSKRAIAA